VVSYYEGRTKIKVSEDKGLKNIYGPKKDQVQVLWVSVTTA